MTRRRDCLSSTLLLISGLLATIPGLTLAQESPARATLLGELSERYQPEVAVSGSVVVGVMGAAAVSELASDRLTVSVPTALEQRRVCLRVTSRDGVYSSENRYELPAGDRPGDVALPYATEHEDVVRGFADTDVAMTASPGDCDDPDSGYLVVGGRNDAAELVVFVNSFEATDVYWSIESGAGGAEEANEPSDCLEITEGRRTTFDFHCRVSRPAAPGPFTIRIERERFGRPQPEVAVRILGEAE